MSVRNRHTLSKELVRAMRPSPAESAAEQSVGTVMKGNDGSMYVVVQRTNGKKWAKYTGSEKKKIFGTSNIRRSQFKKFSYKNKLKKSVPKKIPKKTITKTIPPKYKSTSFGKSLGPNKEKLVKHMNKLAKEKYKKSSIYDDEILY